jgi:UDP-N-acetylmuramoyl-tripeptide--D-alanyl-D-alanine ligase
VVLIAGKGHEKEQILASPHHSLSTMLKLLFPRSANWAMVECAMKLTLAEAAIGAGAVLEAPASFANAGRWSRLRLLHRLAHRGARRALLCRARRAARRPRLCCRRLERGAVAAVVSRARVATLPDAALAVPLLIAEDPLIALQALAAHVRRQWGKRVVAVTGSAGKTTTKEAIAAALGAKVQRAQVQGNLNNAFGLPLQLLRLEPEHESPSSRWA